MMPNVPRDSDGSTGVPRLSVAGSTRFDADLGIHMLKNMDKVTLLKNMDICTRF
jgi:hypothetical protein